MYHNQANMRPDGSPLAVCLNDCRIDYGQDRAELAPVCFQLKCAFAEMRWGKAPEVDCNPGELLTPQLYQILTAGWQT